MLRDVLRPGGTGYRAASTYGFDRPAAGKTGTTQNWKDAWFTGFTPDLVASVWVGFDRNSISLGRGQAGGVVAAPIWAQFMRDALQDKPATWYSRPKGVYAVKVCKKSGLLPTKNCKDTMTEYFLEGTIPTDYCTECKSGTGDNSFNTEIFKRKKSSSDELFKGPKPAPMPSESFPGTSGSGSILENKRSGDTLPGDNSNASPPSEREVTLPAPNTNTTGESTTPTSPGTNEPSDTAGTGGTDTAGTDTGGNVVAPVDNSAIPSTQDETTEQPQNSAETTTTGEN